MSFLKQLYFDEKMTCPWSTKASMIFCTWPGFENALFQVSSLLLFQNRWSCFGQLTSSALSYFCAAGRTKTTRRINGLGIRNRKRNSPPRSCHRLKLYICCSITMECMKPAYCQISRCAIPMVALCVCFRSTQTACCTVFVADISHFKMCNVHLPSFTALQWRRFRWWVAALHTLQSKYFNKNVS